MIYTNICVKVPNYETDMLNKTLIEYGGMGFKLVNVVIAENRYDVDVMYLFFTKGVEE